MLRIFFIRLNKSDMGSEVVLVHVDLLQYTLAGLQFVRSNQRFPRYEAPDVGPRGFIVNGQINSVNTQEGRPGDGAGAGRITRTSSTISGFTTQRFVPQPRAVCTIILSYGSYSAP